MRGEYRGHRPDYQGVQGYGLSMLRIRYLVPRMSSVLLLAVKRFFTEWAVILVPMPLPRDKVMRTSYCTHLRFEDAPQAGLGTGAGMNGTAQGERKGVDCMKVPGSIPADVSYTGYASDTSKSLGECLRLRSNHNLYLNGRLAESNKRTTKKMIITLHLKLMFNIIQHTIM